MIPESDLFDPDERVLARFIANHYQDGHPFDGRLYVTDRRLAFMPSAANVVRGAYASHAWWPDVTKADVAPRAKGAPRKRLRITTATGQVQLFVVWRPSKVARLAEDAKSKSSGQRQA